MNAPERATEIKAAVAAIIATLTALWGWVGWAVIIWIGTMFLDYAAGTAAARKSGAWASSIARAGLWHKLGEVFAVLVAALCDIALHVIVSGAGVQLPIEIPTIVTPVVLLWYIITELGSIAENAGKLGAPVPAWLRKSLADYKEKIDADHGVTVSTMDTPESYHGLHDLPQDPYAEFKTEIEKDHSGLLDED